MPPSENRKLASPEVRKVKLLIDDILSSAAPYRQFESLMAKANDPRSEAIERYAGLAIKHTGLGRLRGISAKHSIRLEAPGAGHLAKISCQESLASELGDVLANLECVVNRLLGIGEALDNGTVDEAPYSNANHTIWPNVIGSRFATTPEESRAMHVRLPRIGATQRPDVAYFNELDWRCIDNIASNARSVFQKCLMPNFHQAIGGISAKTGSDWDVRTRLATILESLALPLPISTRFDCDTQSNSACVHFTLPLTSGLPSLFVNPRTHRIEDVGEMAHLASQSCGIRLACLMGAACFGAGRHLERAYVVAESAHSGKPVFSCVFDRDAFVKSVLGAIDSEEFSSPSARFNPDFLLRILQDFDPRCARAFDDAHEIAVHDDGMAAQRIEPWRDARPLPQTLESIFHARKICDIDTRHYFGGHSEVIDGARDDSDESVLAAIAQLESIVDELEHAIHPPEDDVSARALFCPHALARAAVSLLDDQMNVGAQAEAFLKFPNEDFDEAREETHYFRAPNALFNAYVGLSDLYQRIGDYRGAEAQADKCISLAPTTASAYFRKADVLADQKRYSKAANVLVEGLRYAVSERDCSLLYYHLALLLWHLGRKRDATAVYVYTTSLTGDFRERAVKIVAGLRKTGEGSVIASASPRAADREMQRAGIPHAPNDMVLSFVITAAMELCGAHAPEAAAPYAEAVCARYHDDSIIVSTCRSIIFGTSKAKRP